MKKFRIAKLICGHLLGIYVILLTGVKALLIGTKRWASEYCNLYLYTKLWGDLYAFHPAPV